MLFEAVAHQIWPNNQIKEWTYEHPTSGFERYTGHLIVEPSTKDRTVEEVIPNSLNRGAQKVDTLLIVAMAVVGIWVLINPAMVATTLPQVAPYLTHDVALAFACIGGTPIALKTLAWLPSTGTGCKYLYVGIVNKLRDWRLLHKPSGSIW